MTSSSAQPHVGGLGAHPFLSQTRQHRAEESTSEELNASWKEKLADHQCSLQHSRSSVSTRARVHGMGRGWKHCVKWEHERNRNDRKDSARGRVFPTQAHFFSRSASNSFTKQPLEHKLTGAHRLAWILFNIQRCSLILLGISLEIPAKHGNSTASQTALK